MLLAPGGSGPLLLEGCGPQVWELLAVPMDGEELLLSLANSYGADPELLRQEVTGFVAQLTAIGAVEAGASAP